MNLEVLTLTDERVFSRPDEFLCERWTTEPELVKDSSAFIPFNSGTPYHLDHLEYTSSLLISTGYIINQLQLEENHANFLGIGPYSCVGKQLALMELRCVTAEILTRYDISFAPNQEASAFWEGKKDTFTLVTAPLELVFKEREKKKA
jgi:cytochrome P450